LPQSPPKNKARPAAVLFTERILSKVQLGLVCGIKINLSVHTSLPQSPPKNKARPAAVLFTERILSKVQLGLVCGTGINLSVHTSLPQSPSIKYRQGQSQCYCLNFEPAYGTKLSTSFYKVQVRTSLWYKDKFERAYILATESFYKIQARPVAVFIKRI
jgi:hypothetical protein